MSERNTGGPAFPAMHFDLAESEHGMTLRDYFAGKALQGLLAATRTDRSDILAKDAYNMADAMLEARK